MAASASMKQPTTSSSTFTDSRKTSGEPTSATIIGPTVCGMREIDRHQPSAAAAITSASTTPVVSTVSTMMRGRSRRSKSR